MKACRLVLASALAAAAAGCLPEPDYMPLCVGNRWDYVVTRSDGLRAERSLEVVRRLSKKTWQAREGTARSLAWGGMTEVWSREDDIISVQELRERQDLLYLPPATGLGWQTRTPDGERVWSRVAGRETVKVPAGTFLNCVVVSTEASGPGGWELRRWFAPGVGLVRYSEGPRGGRPQLVRELAAYDLRPSGSDPITPLPERKDKDADGP